MKRKLMQNIHERKFAKKVEKDLVKSKSVCNFATS